MNIFKEIVNKAIQVNAFLYRNLRHCPINIKLNVLAARVWLVLDPIPSPTLTNLKPFRELLPDSVLMISRDKPSVTALLTVLDLPSLKSRRTRAKVIMMYEIINDLVNIPINYFISPYPPLRRGF